MRVEVVASNHIELFLNGLLYEQGKASAVELERILLK
jgi:hypothetical protein